LRGIAKDPQKVFYLYETGKVNAENDECDRKWYADNDEETKEAYDHHSELDEDKLPIPVNYSESIFDRINVTHLRSIVR
jgi:hypothetical protein